MVATWILVFANGRVELSALATVPDLWWMTKLPATGVVAVMGGKRR
jgi:hypothetical protein